MDSINRRDLIATLLLDALNLKGLISKANFLGKIARADTGFEIQICIQARFRTGRRCQW